MKLRKFMLMTYRNKLQAKALKYQKNKCREPSNQQWHREPSERLQEQVEQKIEAFVDQAISERLGEG